MTLWWSKLDQFPFGDGAELADQLLVLILSGRKTATCWSATEGAKDTHLVKVCRATARSASNSAARNSRSSAARSILGAYPGQSAWRASSRSADASRRNVSGLCGASATI